MTIWDGKVDGASIASEGRLDEAWLEGWFRDFCEEQGHAPDDMELRVSANGRSATIDRRRSALERLRGWVSWEVGGRLRRAALAFPRPPTHENVMRAIGCTTCRCDECATRRRARGFRLPGEAVGSGLPIDPNYQGRWSGDRNYED